MLQKLIKQLKNWVKKWMFFNKKKLGKQSEKKRTI